jgi:hypothetical protein
MSSPPPTEPAMRILSKDAKIIDFLLARIFASGSRGSRFSLKLGLAVEEERIESSEFGDTKAGSEIVEVAVVRINKEGKIILTRTNQGFFFL